MSENRGLQQLLDGVILETGIIDGAVLTRRGEGFLPVGQVVRDGETVLACAGSSYVASPTLEALRQRGEMESGYLKISGELEQKIRFAQLRS